MKTSIDQLAVSTIRSLCIDTINKAKSGHPGMALGSAPILHTLFTKFLVSNPNEPKWENRDRFVLSAGHASSLLYVMLHLCNYDVSMDDLKEFRQLNSLTPGHPEFNHTPGVDATSGPLGQGIAQAVGMALAEEKLRASFKDGEKLVSHYTYCLCGDGCLQEGLSQEAISFAGHQKLNKLILFYDANNVTLDGSLGLSFSEEVKLRFLASEWNVIEVKDGNNLKAIEKAVKKAKKSLIHPTMIMVHTTIGYGSKNAGTSKVHGSPLGDEDGKFAKASYNYDYPEFVVPEEVKNYYHETFVDRGVKAYDEWKEQVKAYSKENKNEYKKYISYMNKDANLKVKVSFDKAVSTRVASGKILNALSEANPFLMGGSADVAGSVMTKLDNGSTFDFNNRSGNNINFGIREFAMASIQNGVLLHGGLRTYVGSFLVFCDYMKSAIRTACLSKLPAIYLFSHDSIAVGEDGPTHQPIEHLAMLRSIPNIKVYRPCDANETLAAWKLAMTEDKTPSCLILSRQNLPIIAGGDVDISKGAYVISKEQKSAKYTIIATGSEVSLAIEAQKELLDKKIDVRVVSMPCVELFNQLTKKEQDKILGNDKNKCIVVEMLSSFGWHKYADNVMSIDTFGTSAPANDAMKSFKFTSARLVSLISKL